MKKTYQPTDQDLIRWVGTWKTETEVNAAGYHFGLERPDWRPVPGEVVVVHAHGRYRRGVVTSVGRLNAQVHLTSPAGVSTRHNGFGLPRTRPFVRFSLVAGAMGSPEMVDGTFGQPAPVDPVAEARHEDSREYHRKLAAEAKRQGEVYGQPAPETPEQAEVRKTEHDREFRADLDNRARAERDLADRAEKVSMTVDQDKLDAAVQELTRRRDGDGSAPTATADSTGSAVVMVLEEVWDAIRQNHPELPAVVIVTGSGFVGKPKWGHFRRDGWQHRELSDTHIGEMFVAGETLARGAAYTVETMLHEAAHVLARVRDVQDTSRQGRWHNGQFQKLAEELGLEYRQPAAHPQFGYSEMLLTPGTLEEYGPVIAELEDALRLHVALPEALAALAGEEGKGSSGEHIHHGGRGPRPYRGPNAGSTNNVKAVCECPTPRIIRASRKVLEQADIVCGKCRAEFEPEASKVEPTDEDS